MNEETPIITANEDEEEETLDLTAPVTEEEGGVLSHGLLLTALV